MRVLLLLTLLFSALLASAQSFTVRGTVRDHAHHLGLPGVTVLEKGTTHGVSTDAQGHFMLVTTQPRPHLLVSFIGYVTQDVAITKNETDLVVVLREDGKMLSEVVVVGYATTYKRDVTGSVATVTGATSALSGRVAGVAVRGAGTRAAMPRVPRHRAAPRSPRPAEVPDMAEVPGMAEVSGEAPATEKEVADADAPAGKYAGRGRLTAGELNDFGKWALWPDVARQDLREWHRRWQISPLERYSVQLVTEEGFPVVGATVQLRDGRDSLLWQAQSDNTGKCELWNDLFANASQRKAASLQAVVGGQTYALSQPKVFADGLNLIRVRQACQAPTAVDIAFVVDATASMGDEIKYLQAELADVITQVKDSLKTSSVNLGSVFYRDNGDEYLTRTSPFSSDLAQTMAFMREQRASGGGDTPEAVEAALAVAVNELAWSPQAKARLLFLVLDAPPHEDLQVLASLQQSIRRAAARGIRIIPLTASGLDKSGEYLMRAMALATNGTYVFLTDDSGIGNSHLKPSTDQFTVELLTPLLVKLIARYAYTTDCRTPTLAATRKLTGRYQVADSAARRPQRYAWQCYPNPTSDMLHVELEEDIAELFVTDVTGKLVLRAVPTRRRATLQLSDFPTGIYFLRFFTSAGWEQAKFVVSR